MAAPKQKKELIIRESLRLFYEEGYEKTTMRKIAQACGVSHPAIFKHFRNKAQAAELLVYRYVQGIFALTRRYVAERQINIDRSHKGLAFYWTLHFTTMKIDTRLARFMREYNASQDFYISPVNGFLLEVFKEFLNWEYEKNYEEFWLYSKLLSSSAGIIGFGCSQSKITVEKGVIELLYLLYSVIKAERRISDQEVSRLVRGPDVRKYLSFDLLRDMLLSNFGTPYEAWSADDHCRFAQPEPKN